MNFNSADNMAPLMFAGMNRVHVDRYPAAFSLAATGCSSDYRASNSGLSSPTFSATLPTSCSASSRTISCSRFSVLHLHGRDTGALRPRRGPPRFDRPVVRGRAWRSFLRGDLRGRGFSRITGTVAAAVIAMGVISIPVMMRNGYSVRHTME